MATVFAQGQARTYLNIGDKAPELRPAKWLKGTPVANFAKGKVYVVEFWATWCGPCKENIPHLTEMAKKYAGKVDISGVNIWENNDPAATGTIAKVESFVKEQGDRMVYNVAVDGPDGKVGNTWMKAADEGGLPASFIVGKDGNIAWIGHPGNLPAVLDQIVDDKFDVAAARTQRAAEVETVRPIREALTAKAYAKAVTLIDAAIVKKPEQERIYTYDRLVAQFHAKPYAAMEEADRILKESEGHIGAYRMIASIFASQDDLINPAYRYGKRIIDEALKKGEMTYLFLAMRAEVSESLGEREAAIKWQTEAIKVAEGDPHATKEFVDFLRKNLARMEKMPGA